MDSQLKVYKLIDKLPWPKSYSGKFLAVAFVGIHIPLLALIAYLLPANQNIDTIFPLLLTALIGTLGGMGLTLWVLSRLLKPLTLSSAALREYTESGQLPKLPVQYDDEAGRLMANIQSTVQHLNELIQLKNKLLSVLAHDARNPINSILIAQNLIGDCLESEHPDREDLKEYNQIIKTSAEQQLDMMSNILTMARIDSGEIELSPKAVHLRQLFEEIHKSHILQLETKNMDFDLELNTPADTVIHVDEPKLKGAINNLIENAIKYTNSGGKITLGAKVEENQLKIYVSDNGIGIEDSKLEELFDFKEQLDDSDQESKREGLGIGLWITKTFTKLHGGSVKVESELGMGSTFTLVFNADDILVQRQPAKAG